MYEEIGEGADAKMEVSCPRLHAKLRAIIESLRSDHGLVLGTCFETPVVEYALVVLQLCSTNDTQ